MQINRFKIEYNRNIGNPKVVRHLGPFVEVDGGSYSKKGMDRRRMYEDSGVKRGTGAQKAAGIVLLSHAVRRKGWCAPISEATRDS